MLDRFRHPRVQDVTDVRAIDAHAERHRSDNEIAALLRELILCPAAVLFFEPGVIRQRLDPLALQKCVGVLDILSPQTIDDARLAGVAVDDFENLLA